MTNDSIRINGDEYIFANSFSCALFYVKVGSYGRLL